MVKKRSHRKYTKRIRTRKRYIRKRKKSIRKKKRVNLRGGAEPFFPVNILDTIVIGGLAVETDGTIYSTANNAFVRVITHEDYTNPEHKFFNGRLFMVTGSFVAPPGVLDGDVLEARFNRPQGIAVLDKKRIIVADTGNNRIRMIDRNITNVTTIAGTGEAGFADGTGLEAQFNHPQGIAVLDKGRIIVADTGNHQIRMIDINTKDVTTIAGTKAPGDTDGTGLNAQFKFPTDVAVFGETIVVADQGNNRICKIELKIVGPIYGLENPPSGWLVTTIDENGEDGGSNPMRVAIDSEGNIIFNDKVKKQLRKIAAGW